MAAPSTTATGTPGGIRVDNGYQTLVAFSNNANIKLWEKTVTPSSDDGGDPIDTTTMRNTSRRTKAPRTLVDGQDGTIVAAFDPDVINELDAMINVSQEITWHFPDGSTYDIWGYVRQWEFSEFAEGEQPEITITVVQTDYDAANNVEAGPVLTEVAGT